MLVDWGMAAVCNEALLNKLVSTSGPCPDLCRAQSARQSDRDLETKCDFSAEQARDTQGPQVHQSMPNQGHVRGCRRHQYHRELAREYVLHLSSFTLLTRVCRWIGQSAQEALLTTVTIAAPAPILTSSSVAALEIADAPVTRTSSASASSSSTVAVVDSSGSTSCAAATASIVPSSSATPVTRLSPSRARQVQATTKTDVDVRKASPIKKVGGSSPATKTTAVSRRRSVSRERSRRSRTRSRSRSRSRFACASRYSCSSETFAQGSRQGTFDVAAQRRPKERAALEAGQALA